MADIKKIVELLKEKPSKTNWDNFGRAIKASKIKYYSTKFDKGKVDKSEDLRKAYVELYDSKEKMMFSIPIVMAEGKKIRGATIYLKGLTHLNKL